VVPSAVVASLGTASRTIAVSWADNSADETGFEIQRSTTVNGVYTVVGTAPAVAGTGTRSFLDSGGALLTGNGATYFYRVVSVRGADRSAVAQSAALATPAAAQSVTGLAATSGSATRITLNWANRVGATTNQIFRSVNGAAFTLVTSVGAGVITFNDDTVAAPNNYRYHVDATNWAGATPSVNTAALVPVAAAVLAAPTGLAATTVTRPVLTWVDASTGETNYRASRTPITVNANGSVTAGATTVISSAIAANATTFTDTANQANNTTVRYDVSALNGATVGTAASVYTAITGLPQANQPTATRTNLTARVTVGWTALATASVGGYEIQRCVSTGANSTTCAANSPFTKVSNPLAVLTAGTVDGRATATYTDNGVARNTNYVYRMRTVGGAGTGLVGGTFSASRAVSTN
jgi:titin